MRKSQTVEELFREYMIHEHLKVRYPGNVQEQPTRDFKDFRPEMLTSLDTNLY